MAVANSTTRDFPTTGQPTETHWHYRVYGQRLCSSLPLPELPRCSFQMRDVAFRSVSSDAMLDPMCQDPSLLTRRATDLGCDLSLYRTASGFLLRWEGQCDFLVSRDGRWIQSHPYQETASRWVQNTLYSMILSFALHLRGVSNFHASAIVLPGGVVGFMASPGTGKSSLATGFAAAGHPFFTDDVLAIQEAAQRYCAYPGFPHVSLSPQSMSNLLGLTPEPSLALLNGEKQRVSIEKQSINFSREPAPLEALFVLNRGGLSEDIRIQRLAGAEATRSLLENTNCLPLLPVEVMRRHLAFVAQLVMDIPVYRLDYPSAFQETPRVIAAILDHGRRGQPAPAAPASDAGSP